LSGAELNKMRSKTPRWESELWTYLSRGNGIHCPIYETCQTRRENVVCMSEQVDYMKTLSKLVDRGGPDSGELTDIRLNLRNCMKSGRIFQLVARLANKYLVDAGIDHPPIPTNLITKGYDNLPIEVRQVSLKASHGCVSRLSDCWLVHLSSNDTPARQRFTLYHEVFHILAHCKATPVFHKASSGGQGSFNELLADHFAMIMLVPEKWLKERWKKVKDVNQMAAMFDVPKIIMWAALYHMRFI
jgi:hypothetical protein